MKRSTLARAAGFSLAFAALIGLAACQTGGDKPARNEMKADIAYRRPHRRHR